METSFCLRIEMLNRKDYKNSGDPNAIYVAYHALTGDYLMLDNLGCLPSERINNFLCCPLVSSYINFNKWHFHQHLTESAFLTGVYNEHFLWYILLVSCSLY